MDLVKHSYKAVFLNVILLDWIDSTVLMRELVKLNL